RAFRVTGVQTCPLPFSERELRARGRRARLRARDGDGGADRPLGRAAPEPRGPEGVPGHMTLPIALIGAKALYLLYAWLVGCIIRSEERRVGKEWTAAMV